MKHAHLLSALAAAMLAGIVLLAGSRYATSVETRYVHALAGQALAQKRLGVALQKTAFGQGDLLPVYGASELTDRPGWQYVAHAVFRKYPTGFDTFEVASGGVASLEIAQALAAIGQDVRGKKLVISLTPTTFFFQDMIDPLAYSANFSRLHAYELAFSTSLSFDVKHTAARRMLQYPRTLDQDPLLRFGVERLADGSAASRLLYAAALPLGRLQVLVLQLQDHWETLRLIESEAHLQPRVPRKKSMINWTGLLAKAVRDQKTHSDENTFGIENDVWNNRYAAETAARRYTLSGEAFRQGLERSAEWTDLEVLLRVVKELGAEPLVVGIPMNGPYWDAMGVSRQDRELYYEKLQQLVESYGVPAVDFRQYDGDKYFTIDPFSHPSRKAWILIDQVLDGFYHGAPISGPANVRDH